VALPLIMLAHPLARWRGMSMTIPLPTFEQFLLEMAGALVVEEILFYYSHRLLHSKMFYGPIHKMHHEWTAPIGVAALYCHPLEHVFSNVVPVFLGPFFMGSHVAVLWVWQLLATINTVNSHCGYHFPLMPSPESHDFHHLRYNQNFGVLGVLDYLHSTDGVFRGSAQYGRHRTYFSLDDYPNSMAATTAAIANAATSAVTAIAAKKSGAGVGAISDDGKMPIMMMTSDEKNEKVCDMEKSAPAVPISSSSSVSMALLRE